MAKISSKLIVNHKKLKLGKIINFSAFKLAKEALLQPNLLLEENTGEMNADPSHNVYSTIQVVLSYFAEELSVRKEFRAYYRTIGQVQEAYMPSFPPLSPITVSFFTYWAFCDFRFGREKETIVTICSDIGLKFRFDELVMSCLSNFKTSCMRFYRHMGFEGDFFILKDIFTGRECRTRSSSGYSGEEGEIWYIRIVPNLDNTYDYYVTLTTPYVIVKSKEKDWLDFLQRQGIRKGDIDAEKRYINFMKHNSNVKYWQDYILDAYVSFKSGCIFLTGIPDIKGSKPHELT